MEQEKPKRPRIGVNRYATREGNAERGDRNDHRAPNPFSKSRDDDSRPKGPYAADNGRPQRSFNNDRPAYGNDRPQRSFNNDRPAYGNDRPQRSFNNDRPAYGNDRPQRSFNNDRPAYGNDRPQRSFNNDRPAYGNDRPQRSFNNDRPAYGNDRPQRSFNNDRPAYGNDRPQRSFNNDRPKFGGRPQPQRGAGPQRRNDDRENDSATKFQPRQRVDYADANIDPLQPIRLNKYMANAGVCSRREADELIKSGTVKVNGIVVNELGSKVLRSDTVTCNDQVVTSEKKVYVLLNKPKDCVTTSDDPQGRLTVMDIVRSACTERIYPVGRLDRNTTGVLLLTNDGELASKLTHPKFVKKKIYHVFLDKDVTEEDLQRIADGVELEDGIIHADAVSYATDIDKNQVGIEIHSGRNRVVRRIFEHLGYKVYKLDRVYFAGLTKKNLPRGRWRHLTQDEVNYLRMGAFE